MTVFQFDPARLDGAAAQGRAKPEPALVLDGQYAGEIRRAPATKLDEKAGLRFIIAQFASSEAAHQAYGQLTAAQSPAVDVAQFGQSVLVQAPQKKNGPAQKIHEALVEAGGKVADTGESNGWFNINLCAVAPSPAAAARIHGDLDAWLLMPPHFRPPAPWLSEPDPAVRRACETYLKIEKVKRDAAQAPELLQRQKRSMITQILNRGKGDRNFYQETNALRDRLQRTAVEWIRAAHDPALDDAVLAHELARPQPSLENREAFVKWNAEMRRLITHLAPPTQEAAVENEDDEGDEEEGSNWRDAVSGKVTVADRTITLQELNFGTPARDLPALADWLSACGFADVRYGVQKHTLRELSESFGKF